MALTLHLGRAPTFVVEKFNEFKSIYSSITAALFALLERDGLLRKKYRFQEGNGNYEQWEVAGTLADTEIALQEISQKLDTYVRNSRLDSRAAAIEELLLSPDVQGVDQTASDGETSAEEQTPVEISQNTLAGDMEIRMELDKMNPQEDGVEVTAKSEKKKKRKNKKPKKHKKRHYDEDSGEEDDSKKRRNGRDVWRRVGSKYIGWWTCILCDRQERNQEDYITHLITHGEAHSPACLDCGNYFESMTAYEDHVGNLGKELIYHCDEEGCGKSFQFKCRLDCHKRMHAGELMYKCNDCGHKLSSIRSIIRHTRAKHLNERPFRCHMCDKAFAIQSQLTRHVKDHISPPHFTCEHCGRTFSSRQGHHYHQLDHLGIKPHKCSVCGKAFRNKTDMVNHERIHSGDRPFTCELCGKSFVEKGALRKHRVVHTREKNFVCSNCGKQFGYKCSLDGHLRKCQQDVDLMTLPSMVPPAPQSLTPHHDKPLEISESASVTDPNDLSAVSSAHDSRDRINLFSCSMPDFSTPSHNMIGKNRSIAPRSREELLSQGPLKGQDVGRLMKKNLQYRPMVNLPPNVSKPSFLDKPMSDGQMYSTYPVAISHQGETLDSDILASVLGQKGPLQSQMDQVHYGDRLPREDAHTAHYRNLNQQDREPHIMDGPPPTVSVTGYNPHRHNQPPPVTDAMMFQHQVRDHHYRQ